MRWWRKCLRLADEVRHLRRVVRALERQNLKLAAALALANRSTETAMARQRQAEMDAECLALMARDRGVALEFLRDAHRIAGLEETA